MTVKMKGIQIMKKTYQSPVLEILKVEDQDILTVSDNWMGWDTEKN